jgi:hypothetical protein
MDADTAFVCSAMSPGPLCGYPESTLLGILFALAGIASVTFFVKRALNASLPDRVLNQISLFWLFLAIFQFYRSLCFLVPFHWTQWTYSMWGVTLKGLLIFTPMCLVILILLDLLHSYRVLSPNAILFFRALFLLFLVLFLFLGFVLAWLTSGQAQDPDSAMTVWSGATDIVLAVFFAMPARALLEVAASPTSDLEDALCVNFCKVGIVTYVLLFTGRTIWGLTHFSRVNYLQNWVNDNHLPDGTPNGGARAVNFAFDFVFDFATTTMAMISVYLIQKRSTMFAENPYYTRRPDPK